MNQNRKSGLLLLAITVSSILLFIIYLFINSAFSNNEKIYYIFQADLYIKTIHKPNDKYGYLLWGNTPNITLSNNNDYMSVYTNISNSILVNPIDRDTIWFCSQIVKNTLNEGEYTIINRPKEINQNKFVIIDGVNETDTTFFKGKDGFGVPIVRKPYIKITIVDNFYHILVRQDSTTLRIETLK